METGPVSRTNWRSALAEPFVTVLVHGNGVFELVYLPYFRRPSSNFQQ